MKTILCYGDSNTFGTSVEGDDNRRYAYNIRWTGVLQHYLGTDWRVIEEGLSGRTTVSADPIEGHWKNGREPLLAILHSHKPLDWVVIKLGTNDLKIRFHKTALEIALGVGVLIDDVKQSATGSLGSIPEILVIAPAPILDNNENPYLAFAGREPISHQLAAAYENMAIEKGVHFLNAGAYIKSSSVDGIHLSSTAHQVLGETVATRIKTLAKSASRH